MPFTSGQDWFIDPATGNPLVDSSLAFDPTYIAGLNAQRGPGGVPMPPPQQMFLPQTPGIPYAQANATVNPLLGTRGIGGADVGRVGGGVPTPASSPNAVGGAAAASNPIIPLPPQRPQEAPQLPIIPVGQSVAGTSARYAPAGGNLATTSGGGVPAQLWNFFIKKGLSPTAVAGFLGGTVAGESGFNPYAVGPSGDLGLWQDMGSRQKQLIDYIGGRQNLGDVMKQAENAWNELNGPYKHVLEQLQSVKPGDTATAVHAGLQFEMPGWFIKNPNDRGNKSWIQRQAAADKLFKQWGNGPGPGDVATAPQAPATTQTATTPAAPAATGGPKRDPMLTMLMLSQLFPKHQFTPITYDPYKVMPRVQWGAEE